MHRSGLIPLDNTSDIAGPLTRSVEDAARVFGVLAGFDARDPLTRLALNASLPANYTQFLDAGGLKARSCWGRSVVCSVRVQKGCRGLAVPLLSIIYAWPGLVDAQSASISAMRQVYDSPRNLDHVRHT